jgi:hypothetical protein
MPYLKRILFMIIATTLLVACGDDGPYTEQIALYDIVTFEGNSSEGASFSFQRRDDSPLINLFANGVKIEGNNVNPQDRMLIGYYPESGQAYTSGNISLFSVVSVNQDTLRIATQEELAGWDADAVFLNSMWRSGKYINMYIRVDHSTEERDFSLTMDYATRNDEYPHLYLVHNLLEAPNNFTRRAYASFDISPIWNTESCKGVIIHINDSNLKTETYTFSKQQI